MSSAALQATPHQPTSLPTVGTHSSDQYTPTESSNREGYYAKDDQSTTPPRSSRRASKRPPTNSASANSQASKNPEHNSSSPMTSRTAVASPVAVGGAEYQSSTSSSGRRRHEPPVAPPRTSSTQHGTSGGSSSRRAARAEERAANAPRRNTEGGNGDATNGYEEASSRSRRAVEVRQNLAPTTTIPIRSAGSSTEPSRENSEVLNRLVFSPPETDLDRERERLGDTHTRSVSSPDDEHDEAAPPPTVATADSQEEHGRRGGRSRHDHSKREKMSRFGDYYLGNTIGEGEFGKVKLGWKTDGGVQVAIKLIRRDSVGNNPSRLAKIYREVSILRGVSHPNIVKLHEMSETERHIGIVLEYASGGELFDYILTHRYLKDNAARRLFAQLVSGVGYLHKKGIVHRDLKLENLLLDRHRNIIITDFGFANTFDPNDELSEEEEHSLGDRDYVKRHGLDKVKANGMRRGDLMQTSCGSPCYAAPELVVSDSLYTGRKVDVWSCGVILYAMLAGYLPFDDDPANPEGDNINLLYKYIVNTPLTFPEYVTPHARDLLRRILVPSPRKRADLFEVARHSWLSEYAHVVEFITSTTTTTNEIQNTTVPAEEEEAGGLARSASVREATKVKPTSIIVGDLARKPGPVDPDEAAKYAKQQRDNKRRTVQVEYVAPTTQTQRGGESSQSTPSRKTTKARSSSHGPIEVSPRDKPLPKDPPVSKDVYSGSPSQTRTRPPSAHRNAATRPHRDAPRATSDMPYMTSAARPQTGGSTHSSGSRHALGAGASRSSYGQPIPPTLADTNVHGRMSQPKGGSKNYVISNPIPQEPSDSDFGRPSVVVSDKFARVSGFTTNPSQSQQAPSGETRTHKRSNTIGEIGGKIFGRSGSIFGSRKKRADQPPPQPADKPSRKYPPVSMSNTMPGNTMPGERRNSIDSRASRRSFSQALGLGKKRSGSITGSSASLEKQPNPRRFSFMKAVGLSRDPSSPPPQDSSQLHLPIEGAPQTAEYPHYAEQSHDRHRQYADGAYDDSRWESPRQTHQSQQHAPSSSLRPSAIPTYMHHGAAVSSGSESSVDRQQQRPPRSAPYHNGYDSGELDVHRTASTQNHRVLQKNKRFDAYGRDQHDHAGSSTAAKRVMDFFRRRGKARGGDS